MSAIVSGPELEDVLIESQEAAVHYAVCQYCAGNIRYNMADKICTRREQKVKEIFGPTSEAWTGYLYRKDKGNPRTCFQFALDIYLGTISEKQMARIFLNAVRKNHAHVSLVETGTDSGGRLSFRRVTSRPDRLCHIDQFDPFYLEFKTSRHCRLSIKDISIEEYQAQELDTWIFGMSAELNGEYGKVRGWALIGPGSQESILSGNSTLIRGDVGDKSKPGWIAEFICPNLPACFWVGKEEDLSFSWPFQDIL